MNELNLLPNPFLEVFVSCLNTTISCMLSSTVIVLVVLADASSDIILKVIFSLMVTTILVSITVSTTITVLKTITVLITTTVSEIVFVLCHLVVVHSLVGGFVIF